MSIYKNFRNYQREQATQGQVSNRFDQPTYMSFRLVFGGGEDLRYNKINSVDYDTMPHPLFKSAAPNGSNIDDRTFYSSIDYLLDVNEITRAEMLRRFISHFNQIQLKYQYYFQSVEGVGELLKIDPKKGMRVLSDKRLTITMLEGLDLRSSYLLNMYRKIVWDDTYQRWILPDMMRYFTLDIYVTEFRTFHSPNQWGGMGDALYEVPPTDQTVLRVINDIFPSWVIRCEMCEFDIMTFDFPYLSNLDVGSTPEEAKVKFGIKIGKIYEQQTYPMFDSMYLLDKRLNSWERSGETDTTDRTINQNDSQAIRARNNFNVGQSILGINVEEERGGKHTSGQSFNQTGDASHGALGPVRYDKKPGEDGRFIGVDINPTEPRTWVSNAKTFGKAFGKNLLDTAKNKTSVTPIGGGISFNEAQAALQSKDIVNVFGAARTAINRAVDYWYGNEAPSARLEGDYQRQQPKVLDDVQRVSGQVSDVISAATQTVSSALFDPKQFESNLQGLRDKLQGEFGISQPLPSSVVGMADDAFRLFLEGLSKSQATDPNSGVLIDAAGQILADPALFDEVRSYSLEAGYVDTAEGMRDEIQLGGEIVDTGASTELSNVSMPRVIIEGVPTSVATNNRIIKG